MKFGKGTVDGIELIKVLGTGEKAGWGSNQIRYTAYIDPDARVSHKVFVRTVEAILADARGWIRGGKVSFQRVETGANTQLVLATADVVDKLCYPLNTEGKVSCCQGSKVVINEKRWRNGVSHWQGPLATYRQMLVNHEFGHRTGHGHGSCPGANKVAPVMQQQTYGLQGCRENPWPLDSEL